MSGSRPQEKPNSASEKLKRLYNVFESLVVEKNVLCRKWVDETGKETLKVVVPKFAFHPILKDTHQRVGHLGVTKTFEIIQRRFYWLVFFRDVREFCKNCKNEEVPRPQSPMKPIDMVLVPCYMVEVDLIGPLTLTRQGNRYILTIIDYYTNYREEIAFHNQVAEAVV